MLDGLRSQIDACDTILTDTLRRRLMISARIAAYKKERAIPVYQPEREAAILSKIALAVENDPYAEYIQDVYKCIFRLSRSIQMRQILPYNIVLIGFMGSGKTTVGRCLADITGYAYIDVDNIIEQETGHSIPAIFRNQGESIFRSLERQVIGRVAEREQAIIACGGGCILDPDNVVRLKQRGKLVWLVAEPATIYERIKDQGNRPLLVNKSFADLERKVGERDALYRTAADYRITTDGRSISAVCGTIIEATTQNISRPIGQ